MTKLELMVSCLFFVYLIEEKHNIMITFYVVICDLFDMYLHILNAFIRMVLIDILLQTSYSKHGLTFCPFCYVHKLTSSVYIHFLTIFNFNT